MLDKEITYGDIRDVLLDLGYVASDVNGTGVVFHHTDGRFFVALPKHDADAIVSPMDLLSVKNTLHNSGVVSKDKFESLFVIQKGDQLIWTEPNSGKETEVTAAANESEGTVIIKQQGTFSPCPVAQLRKVALAVGNA